MDPTPIRGNKHLQAFTADVTAACILSHPAVQLPPSASAAAAAASAVQNKPAWLINGSAGKTVFGGGSIVPAELYDVDDESETSHRPQKRSIEQSNHIEIELHM
jgi:hypothetical protein